MLGLYSVYPVYCVHCMQFVQCVLCTVCFVCTVFAVCTVCTVSVQYNIAYIVCTAYNVCTVYTFVYILLHYRSDTQEVLDPRLEPFTNQSSFDLSTVRGLLEEDVRYSVRMVAENDIGRGNYSEPLEFTCELHIW